MSQSVKIYPSENVAIYFGYGNVSYLLFWTLKYIITADAGFIMDCTLHFNISATQSGRNVVWPFGCLFELNKSAHWGTEHWGSVISLFVRAGKSNSIGIYL